MIDVKPISWNIDKGLVAPEWWWVYDADPQFITPIWKGGGDGALIDTANHPVSGAFLNASDQWVGNVLGLAIDLPGGAIGVENQGVRFSNITTDFSQYTFIILLQSDTVNTTTRYPFATNNGGFNNGGLFMQWRSDGARLIHDTAGGGLTPSLIGAPNATDYFVYAASYDGTNIKHLLLNLTTGALATEDAALGQSDAGDGFAYLGSGGSGASTQYNGRINFSALLGRAVPFTALLCWAYNPFGPLQMAPHRFAKVAAVGRVMSSLAGYGGLAGHGGIAGQGGGLAA